MNQAGLISSLSRFTWNEVFFNSFQSGYLRTIDWGLYTCLESAISKRLYRFLDKRFYHSGSIDVDLKDLAFNSIGLSNEYNVAQIKRTLMRGVAELEAKWGLKALKPEDRFVKKGKGDWIVRFERRMRPSRTEIITEPVQNLAKEIHQETTDSITSLQIELTKRGIGPANAEELVQRQSTDTVRTMIELFDWYNKNNQPRGVGFLVQSIRSPAQITFP